MDFSAERHVYNLQYKDTPFRMLTGDGEVVVLPSKYLEELKHLPSSILSSFEAQYEVLLPVNVKACAQIPNQTLNQIALGDYTNLVISSHLPSQTVKRCLTPRLRRCP